MMRQLLMFAANKPLLAENCQASLVSVVESPHPYGD